MCLLSGTLDVAHRTKPKEATFRVADKEDNTQKPKPQSRENGVMGEPDPNPGREKWESGSPEEPNPNPGRGIGRLDSRVHS